MLHVVGAALLLVAQAPAPAASPAPATVMILPLNPRGGVSADLAQAMGDALLISAGRTGAHRVQGLREVEATMAHEQLKQVSACDSESCAAQIAGALNADQIVFGNVTQVGGELLLTVSRVDARTSTVQSRAMHRCPADKPGDLLDRMDGITRELMGVAPPAAAPVAATPPATRDAVTVDLVQPSEEGSTAGRNVMVVGGLAMVPAVGFMLLAPVVMALSVGALLGALYQGGSVGSGEGETNVPVLLPVGLLGLPLGLLVGLVGITGITASGVIIAVGGVLRALAGGSTRISVRDDDVHVE